EHAGRKPAADEPVMTDEEVHGLEDRGDPGWLAALVLQVPRPERGGDRHGGARVLAARGKTARRDQIPDHSRVEVTAADGPEQRQRLAPVEVAGVDVHPVDGIALLKALEGHGPRSLTGLPGARLPD